jgi:hypothetical protein
MDSVNSKGGSAASLLTVEAEVEHTFIAAARAGKVVRLVEDGDRARLAEPHMVYRGSNGKPMLHIYQVGGYSSQGEGHGWRNVPLARFTAAEIVERPFRARPDYNPGNTHLFPHVIFAIPTLDGRTRAPDGD